MTTTNPAATGVRPKSTGSRVGYVVAIVVNGALLYAVNNVLAWDVLPFLTEQFTRVLPLINLSLAATIAVNVVYLGYDQPWFVSLSQVALLCLSMAATVRLYRVFPFDFAGSPFAWATLTRAVLILALVGVAVAIVVELAKLGTRLTSG